MCMQYVHANAHHDHDTQHQMHVDQTNQNYVPSIYEDVYLIMHNDKHGSLSIINSDIYFDVLFAIIMNIIIHITLYHLTHYQSLGLT